MERPPLGSSRQAGAPQGSEKCGGFAGGTPPPTLEWGPCRSQAGCTFATTSGWVVALHKAIWTSNEDGEGPENLARSDGILPVTGKGSPGHV